MSHMKNPVANTLISVFLAGQVLQKLLATFPNKVDGQQAVAQKKADMIYEALDAYPSVFKVVPEKNVRSRMNICFRVIKGGNVDEAEKAFLKGAVERGLTGLKGHRSVGGMKSFPCAFLPRVHANPVQVSARPTTTRSPRPGRPSLSHT